MPSVLCILAAYFLARWQNHQLSAIVLVALILLLGPASALLVWKNEPVVPIDQILEGILHPFRIFYENGSWAANTQLGLQTASGRAWLLLFWVEAIAALFVIVFLRKRLRLILASCFVVLSIIALVVSYFPDGQYQINESWDGYLADYSTYEDQAAGINWDQASYRIDEYNMNLSFAGTMEVEGALHISTEDEQTEFVFTLYHGYTVASLTCPDAEIQWSQDRDLITVLTNKPVTELNLLISYEGNHQIFYSYREGAMLPGWFPWYPMAGERQIFLNFETVPSGYNTYNRIETASIALKIESGNFDVVSNLSRQEDGTFHGVSDSITLIGGELVLTDDPQVKDYLPLELVSDEEDFLDSVSWQWEEICQSLEAFGVQLPAAENCSILLTSRDLCRHYYNNDVAIFDDYILTWSGGLTVSNVSQQMILGINSDSPLANLVCSMGGLADTPQETLQNWLNILPALESQYELAPVLQQVLTAAEAASAGEEAVIELTGFLCNDNTNGTDRTFLEGMRDHYAAD